MTKQVQQVLQLTYKWYTMLVGQAEGKGGGRRSKEIESAREQRAREGAIDVADIFFPRTCTGTCTGTCT